MPAMAEADMRAVPDTDTKPALQVIVLGSGGGPIEHNTTAFLVRSLASGWRRGSVIAVDAGVHLGAIARILESTQPQGLGDQVPLPHTLQTGAFAGLELHSSSAITNAAHVTQSLIDTYLITHPHLDHISAFVVNTAGLAGNRPKRLAALPSTISAFKTHIFNNVIWPNLSDENNGAGLVTYTRLVEGGSPALGEGEEKGFLELNDGIAVKTWSVSHGHCIEKHSHRGSQSSQGGGGRFNSTDTRPAPSPHLRANSHPRAPTADPTNASALPPRRLSELAGLSAQDTSGECRESVCVYDSSAYFIRDIESGKEVLIFGDVEPDSISLSPRNLRVWQDAAPKVASGMLSGIFIECSYDSSQSVDRLFGHLKPCYIIEELKVLAGEVEQVRRSSRRESKKRKRASVGAGAGPGDGLAVRRRTGDEPISPRSKEPLSLPPPAAEDHEHDWSDERRCSTVSFHDPRPSAVDVGAWPENANNSPLRGLRIVIIHVKDRLVDGDDPREKILGELREEEAIENLGCEFIISSPGQSLTF